MNIESRKQMKYVIAKDLEISIVVHFSCIMAISRLVLIIFQEYLYISISYRL